MRMFVGSLLAETNSFAPSPTGLGAFEVEGIRRGPDSAANPAGIVAVLDAIRDVATREGVTVVEGLCAAAQPLGPLVAPVYRQFRGELLAGVRDALPLDAVMLVLHGAMLTDGCDDCEGDILEAVRGIVGPDVPVGASLDPHCHFTGRMMANADILVAYKEYPHTDIPETAAEAARLTLDTARGRIRPVMGVFDCRMLGIFPTTRPPMRDFVDRMRGLEGRDGILSVSLGHGFAYADVLEAGARLWVIADGDRAKADALARDLGLAFFRLRDTVAARATPLDTAVDALARWSGDKPLILADIADNPGGGARGDSTFILEALIRHGIGDVALGAIWDPGAVQICRDAGVGARFTMRIGGKTGVMAGDPVDVRATVMAVRDDHAQTDFGTLTPMGPSARVRTDGGIDIVLVSRCQQVLGTDLFTGLGVTLEDKRGLVVKSTQHFLQSFGPLVGDVLYVETPGLLRTDFQNIPFQRRDLNYWPRVADPHGCDAGP